MEKKIDNIIIEKKKIDDQKILISSFNKKKVFIVEKKNLEEKYENFYNILMENKIQLEDHLKEINKCEMEKEQIEIEFENIKIENKYEKENLQPTKKLTKFQKKILKDLEDKCDILYEKKNILNSDEDYETFKKNKILTINNEKFNISFLNKIVEEVKKNFNSKKNYISLNDLGADNSNNVFFVKNFNDNSSEQETQIFKNKLGTHNNNIIGI